MIVKTPRGYQVRSERGKPLSKDDLTEQEAQERLKEVERFKAVEKTVKGMKRWAGARRGGG